MFWDGCFHPDDADCSEEQLALYLEPVLPFRLYLFLAPDFLIIFVFSYSVAKGDKGELDTFVNHAHIVRDLEGNDLVVISSDGQPRKSNHFVIGRHVACELYMGGKAEAVPDEIERVPSRLGLRSTSGSLQPVYEHPSFPMYHRKAQTNGLRTFVQELFGTYCSVPNSNLHICIQISSNYIFNLRIENTEEPWSNGWCLGNMYESFFDHLDPANKSNEIIFIHRQPCIEELTRVCEFDSTFCIHFPSLHITYILFAVGQAIGGQEGSLVVAFIPSKQAFSVQFRSIGANNGCSEDSWAGQSEPNGELCSADIQPKTEQIVHESLTTKQGCIQFPPALMPSAHPTFTDMAEDFSTSVYAGVHTPDYSDCIHLQDK